MKKTLLLLSMAVLLIFCLGGCSKNKVTGSDKYSADEVTKLQIDTDTWKLNFMASTDENISISFDGSISDKEPKPTATLQNGVLTVEQRSSDEGLQDQIALGKKGQITLYLPSDCIIPIAINNGMGDIEADSISTTDFQIENNAGYITFNHITADNLDFLSASGDITIKENDIANIAIVTSSGYVQISNTTFHDTKIITKSGEVNLSNISTDNNISVQTGSGDINLNYQTTPDNHDFVIASGSKDITARLKGATYSKETTACKQGIIGSGQYKLEINSDSGTVVVK